MNLKLFPKFLAKMQITEEERALLDEEQRTTSASVLHSKLAYLFNAMHYSKTAILSLFYDNLGSNRFTTLF